MANKFTTLKDRCLYLAEKKGFTREGFCQEIGMSYASFKGKAKNTTINSAAIEKILTIIPDVNLNWLMTGEGAMLRSQEAHAPTQSIPTPEHTSSDDKLLTLIEKQAAKIEAQALEIGRLRERISLISNNMHIARGGDFANPNLTPDFPIGPLPQNTSADTPEE